MDNKRGNKIAIFFSVFLLISDVFNNPLAAQEQPVISDREIYRMQVKKDSLQEMKELKSIIPALVYDLRYATRENFTGHMLYESCAKTYLRKSAAEALKKAAEELHHLGYGLIILDAYRPHAVTRLMWELIGDERYVAHPGKGSAHNRGLAVDLTLYDVRTGTELDMGTSFDHFSDSAHHDFRHPDPEIRNNRLLLKKTMEKYGFMALATEWWHYSWPNDRGYAVLDLDFDELDN